MPPQAAVAAAEEEVEELQRKLEAEREDVAASAATLAAAIEQAQVRIQGELRAEANLSLLHLNRTTTTYSERNLARCPRCTASLARSSSTLPTPFLMPHCF